MLEILKALLLGIVEGITEWLPISSTGHMILVEEFIHMNVSQDFMEMFRVVIQLGAILAVVVLYFKKLWPFCSPQNGWVKKDTWMLWFKVLAAVLPAAIIGLPFDDQIDAVFYNYQTVAVTLILYGILFIVVENYNKKTPSPRKFICGTELVHGAVHRRFSGTGADSRHFPFRRYDPGSHAFRDLPLYCR